MKILSCVAENFASYSKLEFVFQNNGLALISGPTGSGKSTLCDIVPWILFGRTSKGGAVDEVLSWSGNGTTEGHISIELSNGDSLSITRIRTSKSQDLYYETNTACRKRGKDIADTQTQINELLGFDYDLYLSGAYFHEFSQTANFFTTTAKNRRVITEQLVDLTLAKKLTENLSEYKKLIKKEQQSLLNSLEVKENNLVNLVKLANREAELCNKWEDKKNSTLQSLIKLNNEFEEQQVKTYEKELTKHYSKVLDLELQSCEIMNEIVSDEEIAVRKEKLAANRANNRQEVCSECGNLKGRDKELVYVKEEYTIKNIESSNEIKKINYKKTLYNLEQLRQNEPKKNKIENPYQKQIDDLKAETNPHIESTEQLKSECKETKAEINQVKLDLEQISLELADVGTLLDVTDEFRGSIIQNTIIDIQNQTNSILSEYFDGELRIRFVVESADKLEIEIFKDGNSCVYTQLSKGQRQLLKLSFCISVMRAISAHHGINFSAIFLDEIADGCDDNIRLKAFNLLEKISLEYDSVFVIEHSEAIKSMFNNRYEVRLVNGNSEIGQA